MNEIAIGILQAAFVLSMVYILLWICIAVYVHIMYKLRWK